MVFRTGKRGVDVHRAELLVARGQAEVQEAIGHLQDRDGTSFIFVLRPENSSILETKRSAAELSKLGITTTFFIVNGMLPEAASTDSFFKKKWDAEHAIVKRIEDDFGGKKLFYPLRDSGVSGLCRWNR